ncbi:MAG: 60 kDa inner membrane insertion protein, preprotein translocase subunit YidC [candidate division CPR1 bacterium GW2011_GWC1_49_13]|uniref:60 kDa inner membrane insertion protein, preprotein translocase subunit YidC n=1 Tax=candidate division CPR1 bacterium GW2011_GWC1_49_13 TaxID=1618342 RepID=A0A0G1YGK4_9BACT|nr:MAG: 60 kDa inner membrane insertion protein, preprotein translocase subunit YidC [candidate division CPR1 bacterium GW2011_GWC1_49_13]
MNLWDVLLITPLTTSLIYLYEILGQNLGWAIIGLTVALRVLVFPLSLPALKSARVQREIQPELEKIKKKHKDDKQAQAQAQMQLFKERGVNPFAGCLPQILQLVILIALYRVFITNLTNGTLNQQFFFWDLSVKDPLFILPLLAAGAQFLVSKTMLPAVSQEHEAAHASKEKADDFATAFQKQNLYIFPIFTLVLGFQFPAGLMLYWFVSTIIQALQQWVVNRV